MKLVVLLYTLAPGSYAVTVYIHGLVTTLNTSLFVLALLGRIFKTMKMIQNNDKCNALGGSLR